MKRGHLRNSGLRLEKQSNLCVGRAQQKRFQTFWKSGGRELRQHHLRCRNPRCQCKCDENPVENRCRRRRQSTWHCRGSDQVRSRTTQRTSKDESSHWRMVREGPKRPDVYKNGKSKKDRMREKMKNVHKMLMVLQLPFLSMRVTSTVIPQMTLTTSEQ